MDEWNKVDPQDDLMDHHSHVAAYYKKLHADGSIRSSHVSKDGSSVDCVHYLQQPAMKVASADKVYETTSIVEGHKRRQGARNQMPNYDWSATPTTCDDDHIVLTRPSIHHMAAGNIKHFRKVKSPKEEAEVPLTPIPSEPSVQPMQQCQDTPYDNRCYTGAVESYNYASTAHVNATNNVYVVLGLKKGEAPTVPDADAAAHTVNQLWFTGHSLKDNCK